MKPIVIGIAGGTCSGKSTLLNSIQGSLGGNVATLSFDEYFIGSDLYDLDKITNFEDPKLYNFKQFSSDLRKLKKGLPLQLRANSRESSESGIAKREVLAKPIIVIEGFLIFYRSESRALFDKKIYLKLSDDEIIKRRFGRTKGAKHWDDHDYIQNKIIPYHHRYVEPQKRFVDVVVDGAQSPQDVLQETLRLISRWTA